MINKIISLLLIIFFIPMILLAHKNLVLIDDSEDSQLVDASMTLEIDGAIKLYSTLDDDDENDEGIEIAYSGKEETFSNLILHPNKQFYIGTGKNVELITASNYKRLVKKYFTNSPELVDRLGKRGFRFKNLPSMILYHNKKVVNGNLLTKEDVMAQY